MANAPAEAQYIVKTADVSLPNAQALDELTPSGLAKIDNSTGAISIAVPGTDYLAASLELESIKDLTPVAWSLLVGVNSEEWGQLDPPGLSDAGKVLTWSGTDLSYEAVPPVNVNYLTVTASNNLPNSRQLVAGAGLVLTDGGPSGNLTISATGKVGSLNAISTTGFVSYVGSNTFTTRNFTSPSDSIAITNPGGVGGNVELDVNDNTSIQQVTVLQQGTSQGSRSRLNFIGGNDIGVTVVDDGGNDKMDITITTSGTGAIDATFVTNTDFRSQLPSSFPLSTMTSGIMKVTTGTGALTTAVANTDYLPPSANLLALASASSVTGTVYVGNGTAISALGPGAEGTVLKIVSGVPAWGNDETVQADYITKTDYTASLPSSFPLASLATGLLKVTTTTGDLSTAVANTDYLPPSANLLSLASASAANGNIYVGNGTDISSFSLGGVNTVLSSNGVALSWKDLGVNVYDLGVASSVTGTLYVGNGSGLAGLSIGTNGQVLTSNGTTAVWQDLPAEVIPTLSQVLTAGSNAGNQSISGMGSSLLFTPGNFSIGASSASSGTELTLQQGTANFKLRIGTGGTDVTRAIVNGARLYVNAAVEVNSLTSIGAANTLNIDALSTAFRSYGGLSTFGNVYSAPAFGNAYCEFPSFGVTDVSDSVTDQGTAVQMSKYIIRGGYGFSRNWMTVVTYSGAASIGKMRIALDKAYFATEQHPVRVPLTYDSSYYGLICESVSSYMNSPTLTEAHIKVQVCESSYSKRVYGVYSPYDFVMQNPSEEEGTPIYNIIVPQTTEVDKIGYVSAGGEGQIWVCNINGIIENGDYITSSIIPGIGMKQDDDLRHNYSIFKSAFDCDFADNPSYSYPIYDLVDDNYKIPDGDGFKYTYHDASTFAYATITIFADRYELRDGMDLILTYSYDFATNHPSEVGKTYVATLLGGTYCN